VHAVPGAQALVGGETAATLDTERIAARDNRVVMPLILAVVLLVLVALLRALAAPLLLLGSVVLSYAAALGAAGLLLQAIDHPRIYFGLPLSAFLFLVALGVDYSIFLMTRAREEAGRLGQTRAGVLHALTVTGGVITSAGLVLAATFASLSVLPLVPTLQTGIVVAVGVLLDTLVVRSLLVPAVAVDLGARVWWPGRLARRDTRPAPGEAAAAPPAAPTHVG
jgi:putative drug exporter of the RND superfamily